MPRNPTRYHAGVAQVLRPAGCRMDCGFCHSRRVLGPQECTSIVHTCSDSTISVQLIARLTLPLVMCASIGLAVAPLSVAAQAPIRERSEPASGVEGLRRAAATTRNELATAEARHKAAQAEQKRAEAVHEAATKELESARAETERAQAALERSRATDAQARAELNRALDAKR